MRRAALLAVLAALLAGAVPATAQEPPAKRSDSVSFVGFIPEPGVISARFRDGLMYVSAESGLSIYDISDPAAPKRRGRLPLPNFENEDIDIGRNVALISNDPSEGAGLLHIIDISNPDSPKPITSMSTGTAEYGIITSPLQQLGFGWGTGHTASCVADCTYVYLAGTPNGIDIVDLRDPAKPKYVRNFPAEEATAGLASHDVQFDRAGNALVSGAGGVAAYDVSDPVNPQLVYHTDEAGRSKLTTGEVVNDGKGLNDYVHHNSMRLSRADVGQAGDPAADSDVLAITEEDYTRPGCEGAGSFQTWRIGGDGIARNIGRWDVEPDPTRQSLCSAHYFDVRGGLIAQGWYEQGTRFLDVSDPANIRQVGFWIPNKTLTWGALYPPTDPTGEIVYALDNSRGIDVLRFDRPEPGSSPLPTVIAPPGDAPEPGGGDSGAGGPAGGSGGSGATLGRPNAEVRIGDGRLSVKRGRRSWYWVTVRHRAGGAARDLRVEVRLPVGLLPRRRTQLVRRLAELPPRATRTWRVRVRVPRGTRRRELLARARLVVADDANPRDNYAVDRTRVRRRAVSRAAADRQRARDLALMPTVRAPRAAGGARPVAFRRSAYGWVCRLR